MADFVIRKSVTSANLLDYANTNRDNGFFNDITIFAGDETIPANRLILSFHSKYFEVMLKLSKEIVIEIEDDVDGTSIKTLIDFMYCGTITIDNRNVFNLLSGASYLQLEKVMHYCFEFLQSNIRVDNSLDILIAASFHKRATLENQLLTYVSTNLGKIAQTDKFKNLSREELISLISGVHRFQLKETSVYQAVVTWTLHDKQNREIVFPQLFKMIKLDKISIDFLEKVILEEELVSNNPECQKAALSAFRNLVKIEKSEQNHSHLISLGGIHTRKNVFSVFSLSGDAQQTFENFEVGLSSHSSLKLNDHIYVIGGRIKKAKNFTTAKEVVKTIVNGRHVKWTRAASLNKERYVMGASVHCGTLFVAGGLDEYGDAIASTEFYNSAKNKWEYASSLLEGRCENALVSCNGFLYALGGRKGFDCLSSAERLDELNGEWQNIQPMQIQRFGFAAVNCNGAVYALGGQSDTFVTSKLKTVERYDSAANKWEYMSSMLNARRAFGACVLRGKIYVVGGIDDFGNVVKDIECYDPANNNWSVVGKVDDKLYHHTLVAV